MRKRPIIGSLHRVSVLAQNVSVKQAMLMMLPIFVVYVIASETLNFLEYDGLSYIIHRTVMFGSLIFLYSQYACGKKMKAHKIKARLRHDY